MEHAIALAREIRATALRMVHAARASHIGSALSIADILAVLYGGRLRFDPAKIDDPARDRLILSKGHACVAVYAALAEIGVLSRDEIASYGQDFSPLMNHISHKVHGVEFSTGSLGHGLPFAVGKAMAARLRGQHWKCYVLLGDGEMDEGSNWEALMFAAHHGLDNVVAIIDRNNLQSLTTVEATLALEPLDRKLEAFGCRVFDVDGHDHRALDAAFAAAASVRGQPTALIARTVKGKGVSFMENSVDWHYRSPDAQQLRQALAELGVQYA
ncbi:transketolase [Chromobacterium sp. ATCC 53434]|uniref:transketolase n=1 Tax=Chromobacterium TaxID=535 RepID=UPI000C772BF0|nr:transketolase [Chromobacterium sp. ATCC 53434]AUH52559.1 transketolase [Chromobacterium sp. ATCC 53434]